MKKLISLFLTVILALSLVPSAFAAGSDRATPAKFTDVPADAWYWDELDYAMYNGYISGTSASTFSPDSPVTRGQFVTILGRMLKVDTSAYTSTSFKDVDASSWYGPYVIWAQSQGFVNGTSSTTFAPNNNITVEQMGTILANYIGKTGVVLTGTTPQEQYADVGTISGWASKNMELMRQYDLLPVDGKGNVSPRKAATRAEATVSLVRLAKAVGWGTEPCSEQVLPVNDAGKLAALANQPVLLGKATLENVPQDASGYLSVSQKEIDVAAAIHDEMWATGKVNSSMTQVKKAEVYYNWMMQNVAYERTFSKPNRFSAYGALHDKAAVCEGITAGYNLLLRLEGINCYGWYANSDTHIWTNAILDGELWELDVTQASYCKGDILTRAGYGECSISEAEYWDRLDGQTTFVFREHVDGNSFEYWVDPNPFTAEEQAEMERRMMSMSEEEYEEWFRILRYNRWADYFGYPHWGE